MKLFENKKQLLLNYGIFLMLLVFLWMVICIYSISPVSFFGAFWLAIILPGFALSRIFKIFVDKDYLSNIILWLALGFIFAFGSSAIAMVFGWTIGFLATVYVLVTILLFVAALVLDIFRKVTNKIVLIEFNKIFTFENIVFVPVLIIVVIALLIISNQGSLFKGGDPVYHLSILRKAFDGQPLWPYNLGYIKSSALHIAYGLPVWHVFLATFAKMVRVEMFTAWAFVAAPLVSMSFVVWYYLLRQIFPIKIIAVLGLVFYILFYFGTVGYLFTCIPLPDTFNRLLLLPLCTGLTLKYIFDKSVNYKILWIFSILLIFMAIIHLTQYFYFILLMMLFGLIYLLAKFRHSDFKLTIKRIILAIVSNWLILLPFMLWFSLKSGLLKTLKSMITGEESRALRYGSFKKFDFYTKFAYILAPLSLVFAKNHRRILFILAIFLLVPICYLEPMQSWLMKGLGYIFLNRMYGIMTWHFMVWALFLGFIIILVDKIMTKLPKIIKITSEILLLLFSLGLVFWEAKSNMVSRYYPKIFSSALNVFLIENYIFITLTVALLAMILLLLQSRFTKVQEFFYLKEPKNYLTQLALLIILIMFFSQAKLDILTQPASWILNVSGSNKYLNEEIKTVIQNEIPPKSVFINFNESYSFSTLFDQYEIAYPHSSAEKYYASVFSGSISEDEKMKRFKDSKAEYVFLGKYSQAQKAFFKNNDQYFTPLYDVNGSLIYKIKRDNIDKDF